MKKFGLLLSLCILLGACAQVMAQQEGEVSIFQYLTQAPQPTPAAPDGLAPGASVTPAPAPSGGFVLPTPLPDGATVITITAGGDLTFGGDVRNNRKSLFDKELERNKGDLGFVLRNVRDILAADDLTLVNFETTLTDAPPFKKNNEFVFSAPKEYIRILTEGSIEAVSFENNHAMDHGEQGIKDTTAVFDQNGIVWSADGHLGLFETKGVRIGMLAYKTFDGMYPTLETQVPRDIAAAREQCDIVIVSYHWGQEKDYYPNDNQKKLGRLTIDAGADLVVGHHSHRINPIEEYNGKLIAYSLGNFSFAGNDKPSDMSTFLLQVRLRVKDGAVQSSSFRIIPARISSKTDYNDFIVTPFTDQKLIDNVINVLKSNGSKFLKYPVEYYPVDWQ